MTDALRTYSGAAAELIEMTPDEKIQAIVGTWPTLFDTALAESMGFSGDANFDTILSQALRMK